MRSAKSLKVCAIGLGYLVLGFPLTGCGSDSSGGQAASGANGQVTPEWKDYCTATFTSDVPFVDAFGDTSFTARKGETYLLTEYDTWGDSARVELAYLTPSGPETFEVPVTGGPETFPFTSNCTFNTATEYYAVFADVTIYDSEALTTELCTLEAGTVIARDTTANGGYSAVGLSLDGPQIYAVTLNSLGTLCGGATEGYITVQPTTVLGVTTALVPIEIVLKAP